MANDVKVTLTADDQATEIVRRLSAAVKQLDAQTKSAAVSTKAHGDAAKGATEHFETMAKAIGGVVAAISEIRVIEFVAETIKAADEIGKLAQKTGASTESLSALALVTRDLDISQEQLGVGLKFLSRSLSELQANSQAMAADFRSIGLSAKDLKGLSLDQALVKIAEAQAKFSDGAGKTATILKIFGRSGSELIPVLNALANGGFDEAAKKASDLGLAISDADAKGARRFIQDLEDLKNSVKGVAFEFARGLIGPMNDLIEAAIKFSENVNPAIKAFAVGAFFAATGAVALAGGIGFLVIAIGALGAELAPVLLVIAALGLLGGAGAVVAEEMNRAQKAIDGLAKDPALNKALGIKDKPQAPGPPDESQAKALREARLAAIRQETKDELAATQLGLKETEAIESERFARGITSLQEFYSARRQITRDGVAAQIKEIDKEKTNLEKSPLPENTDAERVKRQTELNALSAKRAAIEKQGGIDNLQSLEAERIALQQIGDEVAGFAAQIARASGDEIGATQVEIEIQARKFEETLRRIGGLSADEIKAGGHALTQVLTDRAAFAEQQRQGDRQIAELDLQKNAINREAAQGLISQRDATLQIAAVERERLPALQKAADLMDAFAAATKDKGLEQAAKQFRDSFANIGIVVDESVIKLANLKETLLSAAQSDLSSFLGDTIAHVNSLSEAFASLAKSIVSSFQRVLGDILATAAVDKIRGLTDNAQKATQATATTAAASALTSAGASVVSGATELSGSAVELAGSGDILLGAATALTAAATALAAAGAATASGSIFSTLAGLGFPLGFASGGFVRGPGSSTSDSIPARLSHGEFVIRADAVKKYGIDFFNALNFGARMPSLRRPTINGIPGFASGGLVTAGSSGGGSVNGEIGLHVSADEGLLVKLLGTRGGLKALRQTVSDNPQAFKAALGIV